MGRLSEEKDILGYDKYSSNMYPNDQGNLPGSFSNKDVPQKHIRKKETSRKISKEKLLPPH